jgi:hypothetical protein
VNGLTSDTVTVGWNMIQNLTSLYHHFKILVKTNSGVVTEYFAKETPFMVERLNPGTNYSFMVSIK